MGFTTKTISEFGFQEETNLLHPSLFLLILLPILFFILKHFNTLSLFTKSSSLPPGPFPWPIFGNILQIGPNNPHTTFARHAQIYGPLISLKLGHELLIVGSSPTAAMEILKTNDRILSGRYIPNVPPEKSSEFSNFSLGWSPDCNDYWKNLRTIYRGELFSSKAIASQACIREKKVVEMLEFIGKMQGKVVKIRDLTFGTVCNMLSNVLVSRDLVNLEDEYVNGKVSRVVRNMTKVASFPNISSFCPMLAPLDLQGLRKLSMELGNSVYKIWDAIIKERKESKIGDNSTPQDFFNALINNGSSNQQINMMLVELLTAATDTSSSTIEWILTELIRNPRCMKEVEEEIVREIDRDFITESDLPKLTYLEACIKETMRLHPAAPLLLPHRALDTCQVMNYTIPKHSLVVVNFWAISRDPNLWEDPLVFKPDRFLESSLEFKGNDFEFIPFGAGRRICPGLPMAAKQVSLVVASLIHSFDWSLPKGMGPNDLDVCEAFGLVMTKKEPLLLIPKAKPE